MAKMLLPADAITKQNMRMDAETDTYQFADDAMLKLIIDDTNSYDAWMNLQQWASNWLQSDMLLQSPNSAFDGIAGLTVPKFTLSNHLSAIVPKIMGGLFYEDPPFLLRPRPKVSQDIVKAKTAVFAYQMEQMGLEEECELGIEQMALLGTCIFKWGWTSKKKKIKKYVRKEKPVPVDTPYRTAEVQTPDSKEFKIEYDEQDIEHPWIKFCDIRTVLVNNGTRRGDARKAKNIIYRDFATWRDLDNLRGIEGYDIPSREELQEFFLTKSSKPGDNLTMTQPEMMRGYLQHALPRSYKSTADPLADGLEILERWDSEKVGVALSFGEHHILIRNEPNSYGKMPFYSANWRNLPDAFYGQGLGQLVGSEQMVEQGTTALALGMLAYGLQPTAVRKKGFNALSQPTRWEQGGIIDVEEDVDKAFKFLEFPPIPPEAWEFIKYSKATSEENSGANQQTTLGAGAAGVKTTGMRSGTGAALVGQANASRLDGPVERFVRQVFKPWLYQMDELNNDLLPTSVLEQILSDELGQAFKIDHIDFRNAEIEYEVLAGAHLGPKKEMAQFLPFLLNLINNPTFVENVNEQGYNFDGVKIFKAMADLAGWKYSQDFLSQMTPQQMQRRMANSPAGIAQSKNQGAQQQNVQKFQQEQQLLEQEQLGKAAGETIRLGVEHTLQQDELEPTTVG